MLAILGVSSADQANVLSLTVLVTTENSPPSSRGNIGDCMRAAIL